jgi:uncharacterized protein (TIGR02246 family)
MKKIYLSLAVVSISVNYAWAAPSESEVVALFDRWNNTLQTEDPAKVAALYANDGVLLPTVSNTMRIGHNAIQDYFVSFLKYKPKGKIVQRYIEILDDNTVADNGIYEFSLTVDGQPQEVMARYTYVYEKVQNDWLIKIHHSSQMPEYERVKHSVYNPKYWFGLMCSWIED